MWGATHAVGTRAGNEVAFAHRLVIEVVDPWSSHARFGHVAAFNARRNPMPLEIWIADVKEFFPHVDQKEFRLALKWAMSCLQEENEKWSWF